MIRSDEKIFLRDWINNKTKIYNWINRVISQELRCRITLGNRTTFTGIPTDYNEEYIELYDLNECNEKGELLGSFKLKNIITIEIIENELKFLN